MFVEGGGSSRDEQASIRRGFSTLFARALGARSKPAVVACGGRGQAFRDWMIAVASHPEDHCLLLVDSEGSVGANVGPWAHVLVRPGDHWEKPAAATDAQLHFMVQTMEAWLLADPEALKAFYGKGFRVSALPTRTDVEAIPKPQLNDILEQATREAKTKGRYTKSHGFWLIGLVDPTKVRVIGPYAERFFDTLAACCEAIVRGR